MFNIIRSFLRNNSSINYKFGYSKPVKATKNPFTGKNVATMEIKDKKLTLSAVANNLNLSENFLRKQMINPMTDTITEQEARELGVINRVDMSGIVSGKLVKKSPVITIMGHVDHGKTTLIDYLRKSNIAEKEHGGITQKVGAFHIKCHGEKITFIDTPGHEVFTNMRKRGASVTDLIVLVVSATEGVKKQTLEVIDIIKSEQLPVIVAINKIDLPNADIEETEDALVAAGLNLDPKGGDIPVVHISAKVGTNVELLSELIIEETKHLQALEDGLAEGAVLQAYHNEQGLNAMTVIVQKGLMKTGSIVIYGQTSIKIKHMHDDQGKALEVARPGDAVQIIGIPIVPAAGDFVYQVANEARAMYILKKRSEKTFENDEDDKRINKSQMKTKIKIVSWRDRRAFCRGESDLWYTKFEESKEKMLLTKQELQALPDSDSKELKLMQLDDDLKAHDEYVFQYMRNIKDDKNVMNIILRFSERGIEETILTELRPIIDKIKKACNIELRIMKSEVGDVMPSDINEAKDARAEIFLFNSKLSSQAASMLANFGMRQPHSHNLIHNFLKDVEESAYNMKRTSIKGTEKGRCEVLDVYQLKPDKRGNVMIVPGVVVTSGKMISAAHEFYIFRNNLPISEPFKVRTLKVFKKDVETVKKGQQCTITFQDQVSNILKKGDEIVCYLPS